MYGMMGGFWPGSGYGGMMAGGWWPVMWLMAVYWLVSLVFIVWALVNIANARKDAGYKLIWAAIVVFLGLLGVIIYYIVEKPGMGRKDGEERDGEKSERPERAERRPERRR